MAICTAQLLSTPSLQPFIPRAQSAADGVRGRPSERGAHKDRRGGVDRGRSEDEDGRLVPTGTKMLPPSSVVSAAGELGSP